MLSKTSPSVGRDVAWELVLALAIFFAAVALAGLLGCEPKESGHSRTVTEPAAPRGIHIDAPGAKVDIEARPGEPRKVDVDAGGGAVDVKVNRSGT